MLKQKSFIQIGRRLNSNFVQAAGLFERTDAQECAKRPLLIQDQSKALNYDEFNKRVGQYTSLLSSKYQLKVSFFLQGIFFGLNV